MYAGEIKNFDEYLPGLLKWADLLIASDELEKAEWLLHKGLPAYYRDNVPEPVIKLREELYKYMMNVHDYIGNTKDAEVRTPQQARENMDFLVRGQLIEKSVKAYNAKGKVPHVFDVGPGDFWLPSGLKEKGYKFTYDCEVLCVGALEKSKQYWEEHHLTTPPSDQPHIFVALEIIEHLRSEKDIVQIMYKRGIKPDEIHLSTPLYTFGGGSVDWREKGGLGQHMRTYTPYEFHMIAMELFPGYNWHYTPSEVQSLIGVKRGSNVTKS